MAHVAMAIDFFGLVVLTLKILLLGAGLFMLTYLVRASYQKWVESHAKHMRALKIAADKQAQSRSIRNYLN